MALVRELEDHGCDLKASILCKYTKQEVQRCNACEYSIRQNKEGLKTGDRIWQQVQPSIHSINQEVDYGGEDCESYYQRTDKICLS